MLDMNIAWSLNLTTAQLNIINRARRGALRAEELDEARELANALARARVRVAKQKMTEVAKLEDNLNAAKDV